MYMLFDVETTGLPKNWKAPMTDLPNWPHVIQLAWLVCDEIGKDQHNGNFLIKPDGWKIPQEEFWIANGFSTEKSQLEGIPIADALAPFINHLQECEYLISHNLSFDYNVLGAEMLRAGMRSERRPIRVCTKEESTEYCKIPFEGRKQYPGTRPMNYKWPKLQELYQKLFGRDFEGAHDAMADVYALKACFFELNRIGVIKLTT